MINYVFTQIIFISFCPFDCGFHLEAGVIWGRWREKGDRGLSLCVSLAVTFRSVVRGKPPDMLLHVKT